MSNTYPAIFILGTLASFLWLGFINPAPRPKSNHNQRTFSRTEYIDAALIALFLGLCGARMGFVYLHWEYYASHVIEIIWLWQGGLTWVGGAFGAILGVGFYSFRSEHSFWSLFDALAIPAGIIALSAWSGCYLDGCAYGTPMPESHWTPVVEDMFGGITSRWPTQMVGIISSLAILISLYVLSTLQLKRGVLGCLGLAAIAAVALALSFTRSDPALLIRDYRVDTIGSAAVLLTALCGFVLVWFKKPGSQIRR
jgi:phosphatidylglycerol---prolipoprotein diacylglyceryl transferase